jgi:spore coat protein U-like protein
VLLAALPRPAQALLTCGSGALFASAVTVSATALNFGNYTPASASYASATVRVECGLLGIDLLPGFTLSLTAQNGGGNPAARTMERSGVPLAYNVYTTSGYGAVWGDGSNGSVTQSYGALLSLGGITYTAWGRLPAGQYVAAGAYSDWITVTVSY